MLTQKVTRFLSNLSQVPEQKDKVIFFGPFNEWDPLMMGTLFSHTEVAKKLFPHDGPIQRKNWSGGFLQSLIV